MGMGVNLYKFSSFALMIWLWMPVAQARHLHPEKYYQQQWCIQMRGVMEYRLADKTRIDCLTEQYAVEVDFATKWAEAVGQSLHYALMTNRQPAILLIMEDMDKDVKHQQKLLALCDRYHITLFTIRP